MDFKSTVLILNTLLNLFLGFLVWQRGVRNQTRLVFVVFSISIAMWSFGLAMFFFNKDPNIALVWARFLYFAGSTIALSLCIFSFIFPNFYLQKKLQNLTYGLVIVPFLIVTALTLGTDLVIKQVMEGSNKGLSFGPFYPLWLGHFVLFMFLAFVNLTIQLRRSSKTEQLQVKYMLIGTLSAAIFASFTNVIYPTLGDFRFFSLGPLLTISMAGFIAYAIIKHRLMDIRLVIARTVAYSVLLAFISLIYTVTAYVASSFFLGLSAPASQLLVYAVLTILVAFSYEKIKKYLEQITDSFLFKGHYDSDYLLGQISHTITTDNNLDVLTDRVLAIIIAQMRITSATIILIEGNAIYKIIQRGQNNMRLPNIDQIKVFPTDIKVLILDEMTDIEVKNLMRELGFECVVILKAKGELVGIITFGGKSSGDVYSEQDLNALEIMSSEIAVAIQNSKSYDKVQKFNQTLKDEVDKATGELKSMTEQIYKANAQLHQLDKLKDDFVSIASHELRTPMTAIRSYTWMALNRPDIPLSMKMKRYLERTLISTERLINLVNDMLNVSRIEAGRIEIIPKAFDIVEMCKDVMEEVSEKAKENQLKVLVIETKIPQVFADPDKVHEILLNLVGNALKFTFPNGTVSMSFFADGKTVEIAIKDTGKGISKEDQVKLFTKFERLDNSFITASSSGGTGLGLYISKSLVELMHGKIWARSAGVNQGTTFTFSLPIATPELIADAGKFAFKPTGEAKPLEPTAI